MCLQRQDDDGGIAEEIEGEAESTEDESDCTASQEHISDGASEGDSCADEEFYVEACRDLAGGRAKLDSLHRRAAVPLCSTCGSSLEVCSPTCVPLQAHGHFRSERHARLL